jgi:hypothetical protein
VTCRSPTAYRRTPAGMAGQTLSVRTVETYVYRAMQKRGVEHRREL